MQYLKVNSGITSSNSGLINTNSEESYIYVKKYDNGQSGDNAIKFPQLHFYGPKNTGDYTSWDEVLATNPKIVDITNTNATLPCNCNLGNVFNHTVKITNTSNDGVEIAISHVPTIPGFGILVRFEVGNGVTIKYSTIEVFNTKPGSDYTAGIYYVSFLFINATQGLKLVNFFKEPSQ